MAVAPVLGGKGTLRQSLKLLLSPKAAEKEVKDLSTGEKVVNQVHVRQTRNLSPAHNSRVT